MSLPAKSFPRKLREGARPAFAVFAAVFLASALITFTRPKIYEATTLWPVASHRDRLRPDGIIDSIAGGVDLQPALTIAASDQILHRIMSRITGDDLHRMLAHYAPAARHSSNLLREVLVANRQVRPFLLSQMIAISYRHPDPVIAARVANMFADEMIQWNSRVRVDAAIAEEELLIRRHARQEQLVKHLNERLVAMHTAYELARSAEKPLPAQLETVAEYQSVQNDLARENEISATLKERLNRLNQIDSSELSSVRRVDIAKPPSPDDYVSPNHLRDLGIGLFAGLLAAALTAHLRSPINERPSPAASPRGH